MHAQSWQCIKLDKLAGRGTSTGVCLIQHTQASKEMCTSEGRESLPFPLPVPALALKKQLPCIATSLLHRGGTSCQSNKKEDETYKGKT